jgi:hypothetical protein
MVRRALNMSNREDRIKRLVVEDRVCLVFWSVVVTLGCIEHLAVTGFVLEDWTGLLTSPSIWLVFCVLLGSLLFNAIKKRLATAGQADEPKDDGLEEREQPDSLIIQNIVIKRERGYVLSNYFFYSACTLAWLAWEFVPVFLGSKELDWRSAVPGALVALGLVFTLHRIIVVLGIGNPSSLVDERD